MDFLRGNGPFELGQVKNSKFELVRLLLRLKLYGKKQEGKATGRVVTLGQF